MLQAIREKVVGWMIWVVLLLVGVPFAFWGVDAFFLGGGDPVVAKIDYGFFDSQKIHQSQLRASYEGRYQQLQSMMGENFRADMFDKARFEKAVLDDMVQESLLRRHAQDAGYSAGDALLFDYISKVPQFQKDGKFDSATYQAALGNIGKSPQSFEAELRSSMEIDQMRGAVASTAFVTPAEAALAGRLQNQERYLAYASFDPASYRSKITLTPEQIKAKYEADKNRFMAPERIKLAYIELALDALPKSDPPDEKTLQVAYDAEKEGRFTTAEQRKASHILVNFGADKDAAKKKIEDLAAQLKAGKSFADLARANSDDTGSKNLGGDLGLVKRGQMVKPFEDALFDLSKAGDVSGPVESQFGWHLIKLDELKPQQVRPFSDPAVKQELIDLFQEREAAKRYTEYQEKLEQLAFENPTSLEPAAKELGLQVQTTDWFTRAGGSGIAANSAVKDAAFAPEIVKDGENSKPLNVGENRVAVIRKAEYEAPRQRALEEVSTEVETALLDEKARAQAAADAEAVLAAVKGGKALADAAKEKGVELQSPGLVKRDHAGIDPAIIGALFKLPRPAAGGASYGKASLPGGGSAVLALSAVQEAPAADAARATDNLRNLQAGAEFTSYRKAIQNKVKVNYMEQAPAEGTPTPATAEDAKIINP